MSIRVQVLDGTWETLGVDRFPGIFPEDVQPAWGPAGPESLHFSIRRPPNIVHADLAPFTPVEMFPGEAGRGDPIWSGFTLRAPPGGPAEATTVECQGWHYYRDENPGTALYVYDGMDEFQDCRASLNENLALFRHRGQVTVGDGAITLSFKAGDSAINGERVGVVMDLGPDVRHQLAVVGTTNSNNTSSASFFLQGADYQHASGLLDGQWETAAVPLDQGSPKVYSTSTWALPRRFLQMFLQVTTPVVSWGADVWVRVEFVRIFGNPLYEEQDGSDVTADLVIKDIHERRCPLLSQDMSRVTPVVFKLPNAAWRKEDATARQVEDDVNDYHGYRLGVDASRRLFFLPQPSVPRLQVDARDEGVRFRDNSSNDGTEVYNKVSVRAPSGAGEEQRIDRFTVNYLPSLQYATSDKQLTNPSAAVDVTGWAHTGASPVITRDTVQFHTTPASVRSNSAVEMRCLCTGPTKFRAGTLYRIKARVAFVAGTTTPLGTKITGWQFGPHANSAQRASGSITLAAAVPAVTFSGWQEVVIDWAPVEDFDVADTGLWCKPLGPKTGFAAGQPVDHWVDSVTIEEATGHYLDRLRRVRSQTLTVGVAVDENAMEEIAKAFLMAHRFVPFRASLTVTGDAVFDLEAGRAVPASQLGLYYGEMIRVTGISDPDSHAHGRDGIIASVSGTDPASLAIDSERRSLEALLARMAVVRAA